MQVGDQRAHRHAAVGHPGDHLGAALVVSALDEVPARLEEERRIGILRAREARERFAQAAMTALAAGVLHPRQERLSQGDAAESIAAGIDVENVVSRQLVEQEVDLATAVSLARLERLARLTRRGGLAVGDELPAQVERGVFAVQAQGLRQGARGRASSPRRIDSASSRAAGSSASGRSTGSTHRPPMYRTTSRATSCREISMQ